MDIWRETERWGTDTQRKSPSSPKATPQQLCPPGGSARVLPSHPAPPPTWAGLTRQTAPPGGRGGGVEPGSLGCLKQTGRGPGATLLGDGPRAPAGLRSLSQAALGTHLRIHLRLGVPPQLPPSPSLWQVSAAASCGVRGGEDRGLTLWSPCCRPGTHSGDSGAGKPREGLPVSLKPETPYTHPSEAGGRGSRLLPDAFIPAPGLAWAARVRKP